MLKLVEMRLTGHGPTFATLPPIPGPPGFIIIGPPLGPMSLGGGGGAAFRDTAADVDVTGEARTTTAAIKIIATVQRIMKGQCNMCKTKKTER